MSRSYYQKHEGLILGGAAVLVAIAIWQAIWSAGKISPLFFTGPWSIVTRFGEEWTHGRLKSDMAYSGTNLVIGVGLAVAAGVVLGVIIGWYRRLAMVFEPFVNALYATPRVALVPLIVADDDHSLRGHIIEFLPERLHGAPAFREALAPGLDADLAGESRGARL